jgi:NAD(P)-dependent dehydrogenase (short-subunit alcohol dehydrogenase family)
VFSFGANARESYERMIRLVGLAEDYLAARRAWSFAAPTPQPAIFRRDDIAALRRAICDCAGFPMLLHTNGSDKFLAFARRADVARISQRGPATPDHVIRTKPLPMLGRDVAAYAQRYREYFERHQPQAKEKKTLLDAAPRMVLDPEFGFAAAGRSVKDARIVEELYDHTIDVILRAEALGGWSAVAERDLFEIEYWDLEQAKLKKSGAPAVFAGEVAVVTGAASGIGKACVESFLARGAAVVALDRNPAIETLWQRPEVLGLACDLTDAAALDASLERGVRAFGGADMLVLNAGLFPSSAPVEAIAPEAWRSAMSVNVEANLRLLQLGHALLKLAPRGGRIVVIGSRNVAAPGPGAAAYSASKAALNQLARVTALEWAKHGIRLNTLHPDAVYDTALWTEELLAARAQAYNLTVEQYKKRNLLKTEVSSRDVAELAAEMCGPLFARTTGAQLPVDGGHDRVI